CDLSEEYCQWAKQRIESIEPKSIEEWIEGDRQNLQRRQSIR
ncbi:MAG: site-specific DNA-methyltransferase, partial [Okeania sp. SIO2H7]|nr:site-specific DNA-methyltransferase [Okeania sp. SIO2H7]